MASALLTLSGSCLLCKYLKAKGRTKKRHKNEKTAKTMTCPTKLTPNSAATTEANAPNEKQMIKKPPDSSSKMRQITAINAHIIHKFNEK
jgi:hypothetical protein